VVLISYKIFEIIFPNISSIYNTKQIFTLADNCPDSRMSSNWEYNAPSLNAKWTGNARTVSRFFSKTIKIIKESV
jgi:hypothetical protein